MRHRVVDVPFKQPNWRGSILHWISWRTQHATNSSNTLERHGECEIGRKSLRDLGTDSLGTGVMFAAFQMSGTIPEAKLELNRFATGSANSKANSLRISAGMLSGPVALHGFNLSSFDTLVVG